MQLHPFLSRQMTLIREREAQAAGERVRLVRTARGAAPPSETRRGPTPRCGCEEPVPA
jgi:hypothetical protein